MWLSVMIGLRFVRGSGLRLSVYPEKSSTQKCVTTATCEVEYVALWDGFEEDSFTKWFWCFSSQS